MGPVCRLARTVPLYKTCAVCELGVPFAPWAFLRVQVVLFLQLSIDSFDSRLPANRHNNSCPHCDPRLRCEKGEKREFRFEVRTLLDRRPTLFRFRTLEVGWFDVGWSMVDNLSTKVPTDESPTDEKTIAVCRKSFFLHHLPSLSANISMIQRLFTPPPSWPANPSDSGAPSPWHAVPWPSGPPTSLAYASSRRDEGTAG